MNYGFDAKTFISTFAVIFVAELPDKTALSSILLATRHNPWAVFIGSSLALTVQSAVAVSCGSILSLIPAFGLDLASGLIFLILAVCMWFRRESPESEHGGSAPGHEGGFVRTAAMAFLTIFIAEWGDLTQFATAALAAKHREPVNIFLASSLALASVTLLGVIIGSRAKHFINPDLLHRIAAFIFAGVGIVFLLRAVL